DDLVRSVEETPEPISTNITGTIPRWISGNFLRNGPGKFEIGNQMFNHWFDGMALMHQFKISNGQVTYKSPLLPTKEITMSARKPMSCTRWILRPSRQPKG
uniref:Uncharacterized protein n=1 Tax=Salarias fasciatus TaxID=181472 RepID=A0A672I6H5_SALFA